MSSFDTKFPADSLEFCPHPQFRDIFVCGTYKLLDQESAPSENDTNANATTAKLPQKRIGQCLTFRLESNTSDELSLYVTVPLAPCVDPNVI